MATLWQQIIFIQRIRANWFSCKPVRSFCLFHFEECGEISHREVKNHVIAVQNEKAFIDSLPVIVLRIGGGNHLGKIHLLSLKDAFCRLLHTFAPEIP